MACKYSCLSSLNWLPRGISQTRENLFFSRALIECPLAGGGGGGGTMRGSCIFRLDQPELGKYLTYTCVEHIFNAFALIYMM